MRPSGLFPEAEYSSTTSLSRTWASVEFAEVLELAQLPEVYMKLSGLNHFAEDAPLYTSARPFTKRVIEAFGPRPDGVGQWYPQIVDAHMKNYSAADIDKVKGGNLQQLLNW